jgi:hypothetical protein
MNSYSLGISGSWLLLIILFITFLIYSIFVYKKTIPSISSYRKSILIFLRTLALTLLLFVLFEPILNKVSGSFVTPKIAILLDNSMSAFLKDEKYDRANEFQKVLKGLDLESLIEGKKNYWIFDEDSKLIKNFKFDSLKRNGQLTNISKAIRLSTQNIENDNIQSILMITDGQFNSGNNPLYDAEKIGKPFYIVGIGDTSQPKDIKIDNLIFNEIAYLENQIPININISNFGFDGQEVSLKLLANGTEIGKQNISLKTNKQNYSLNFDYLSKTEGVLKITAELSTLEGELSTKNNVKSDYVKILKNKRKIAIFSGEPSSDISFLRTNLLKLKGLEVKNYIQTSTNEFLELPLEKDLNEVEMLIFVGFPSAQTPQNILQLAMNEIEKGKPYLFIASNTLAYERLKSFTNYLPFEVISSNQREFLVQPNVQTENLSSSLLKITGSENDIRNWNNLPPIFKTETFVKVKPDAQIVMSSKVNNVIIKEPLVISRDVNNKKSIAILGYGIFRWKLLGYASELAKGNRDAIDLYSTFFDNAFRWLSVENKSKQFLIKTTKSEYTSNENIEFVAQVYDANYNSIDNAEVKVEIKGSNEKREVTLNSIGNGRYTVIVKGLSNGDFTFNGVASQIGRKIGDDNGRFNIGEINLEYQNVVMNYQLLKNISDRTGGKFYFPNEVNNFINDLSKQKSFEQRPVTLKEDIAIWNLTLLLVIAIFAFSMEWLIRKLSGLI